MFPGHSSFKLQLSSGMGNTLLNLAVDAGIILSCRQTFKTVSVHECAPVIAFHAPKGKILETFYLTVCTWDWLYWTRHLSHAIHCPNNGQNLMIQRKVTQPTVGSLHMDGTNTF